MHVETIRRSHHACPFRLFILVLFISLTACGSGSSDSGAKSEPFDVNAAHDALLNEATGYFTAAGGTGGQGGGMYYVINLDDSGPGSLRDALTRTEPLIVLFEDGLNGLINLSSRIEVGSNKTLWGRHRDGSAADIFVHPTNSSSAFSIRNGRSNVIIANLKGDAPGPNDSAPDFIEIQGSGGLVWVHHITVIGDGTSNMDGFVDVLADNVTLSWNRVEDWDNVHLFYPYPDSSGRVSVTMHHNLFRNSAGRQPKLSSANVQVHAYNNWLDNWGYDGMRVASGELVADSNIFTAGVDKHAIQGTWAGSGNVFLNGAFADSQSSVFTPPYAYTLDAVGTAAEQQALRDRLEAKAGWQWQQ
jgi:pectate lyase